jgi:hypothetical protein
MRTPLPSFLTSCSSQRRTVTGHRRQPSLEELCHRREPQSLPPVSIFALGKSRHEPISVLPLIPSLLTHRNLELSCYGEGHGAPPWSRAAAGRRTPSLRHSFLDQRLRLDRAYPFARIESQPLIKRPTARL